MSSSTFTYDQTPSVSRHSVKEQQIEDHFVAKLQGLKYEYRPDIRDRAALERNFREKFEALNRVKLSDGEFARLLDEVVTPDVFTAARMLRERNAFIFLETAELRAKRQTITSMSFWRENVGQIVVSNGFPLLSGAGSVSHARMEQKLEPLYLDFDQRRMAEDARAADAQDEVELKALENTVKNRPAGRNRS